MFDYHVHTLFSADSSERIETYIEAAVRQGVTEICFTDHYDLDFPAPSQSSGQRWEADIGVAIAAITSLAEQSPVRLKCGVEMGLRLEGDILARSVFHLSQFDLDFILASVHLVDGIDPWYPDYFDGKSRQEGFSRYLETIYACLQKTDAWQAVGHIDYPVKGCPYEDKVLRYRDAPDVIDALFTHIIERGKCIEINGSVLAKLGDASPDLEIYQRYAALGGEYITLGSDAHVVGALNQRLEQAAALASCAGIRYVATFEKQTPTMHRID